MFMWNPWGIEKKCFNSLWHTIRRDSSRDEGDQEKEVERGSHPVEGGDLKQLTVAREGWLEHQARVFNPPPT